MDKKNTAYHVPYGFNPFVTADTIRALADSIQHLVTEGEMIERTPPKFALGKLQALMDLLQQKVVELHEYLREIENSTTVELPLSDEEFEAVSVERNMVKEPAAVYRIR